MSGLTRKPRVGEVVGSRGLRFTVTHFDNSLCWTRDANGIGSCFIWWFSRDNEFNNQHTIVEAA